MGHLYTVTAGHGAKDPGNTANGMKEAELMLQLRYLVAKKLRDMGHQVNEDGVRGENWPLIEAIKLIPRSQLAVELHTNASDNPTAQGVEVIGLPHLKNRAQLIARNISKALGIPLRRTGGFYDYASTGRNLGFVKAGGLIVEVFFQSNAAELAAYQARSWLVASAIADGMTGPLSSSPEASQS